MTKPEPIEAIRNGLLQGWFTDAEHVQTLVAEIDRLRSALADARRAALEEAASVVAAEFGMHDAANVLRAMAGEQR